MSEPTDEQDFAAVLLSHAKGRAHTEASKLMREIVEAVTETGKNGVLTVKLTFSRDKDRPEIVKVADDVKATIPKESRKSLWFTDDDYALHRSDPRQGSLFHDAETNEIRVHRGGKEDITNCTERPVLDA